MRIAYLSGSGALGGAERVLLDLAAGMRARGHEVRVVCPEPGPFAERSSAFADTDLLELPSGIATLGESGRGRIAVAASLPLVAWPVASYLRRLRRTLAPWAPDVVTSHGTKAHVLAAWAGLPGAVVWHLHEYVGARPVSARLLRASAARAVGAIAVSGSVRDDFTAAVPGARCCVVQNAVDVDRFTPDGPRVDLDAAAGVPAAPVGTVRIGLVATYAWWKGHEVFLRAMARLPATLPVRGYIVGGPIYRTSASQVDRAVLEARIRALGLDGRVVLTGYVEDVPGVMRALDVVVHASTAPEPFGLVIAEAMASGRPVAVSASGGAAELIEHGVDALAFAPGDDEALARHLEKLAAEPARRLALGQAARRTAEARFERGRMLAGAEAAYEQAVRARP